MRYPIAIHHDKDKDSAYGVSVPDVAGCFSAGDTLDKAIPLAEKSIEFHLEPMAEDDQDIPLAKEVADHVGNPDFAGATWAYTNVDVKQFCGKTHKENVTLPLIVTSKIDKLVRAKLYKSRSSFLTEAALAKLEDASII